MELIVEIAGVIATAFALGFIGDWIVADLTERRRP